MRNKFEPRGIVRPFKVLKHSYLSTVKVMEDGRAFRKSVMVVDDVAARGKGLTPLDFCLENLLENNVDLKSMSMSDCGFVSHDMCVDYLNTKSNIQNDEKQTNSK